MKPDRKDHLQDEQLTWAVIDEKELAKEERHHLAECQLCRENLARLQADLTGLGEQAAHAVPPMTRPVRLPAEEDEPARRGFSWFPSFGAAVMAGLALFIYFLGVESMSPRLPPLHGPDVPFEDEKLMEEITDMVENPLSDEIYGITGENGYLDEEFLDYVVPGFQEEYELEYLIKEV